MNFFFVSALVAATGFAKNLTLSDVYGEVPVIKSMEPWHKRTPTRQNRSNDYFLHRSPEECDFALELYILQDNTASFQDNYAEMKNTQLPLLIDTMTTQHPGTAFGIMSFRDKPIWSLGEPRSNDYCQRFETPLSQETSPLYTVYDRLISTGGGDPSENQFGALVAASQSSTPGWSNPDAVKLIVVATDAPPHFENDGLNAYGMSLYTGAFDEANADTQCLQQYYPTPGQVRDALTSREAYLAAIIYDADYMNGLVGESWQWFNSYIGQTPEFVEPLGNNSTLFWDSLSKVIQSIKDIECEPTSTEAPASSVEATVTTTPSLTMSVPATECPPCPPVGPCHPCHPCHCHDHHHCHCPEVVIKLAHRPKHFRLEVEN